MLDEAETSRYVMLARREWSEQAPSVVDQLEDPQAFFQDLGLRAVTRIGQMCEQMNAQVPQNLSYLERVGQLKAIRKQAEELVLQELIYEPLEQPQCSSQNPGEQLGEVQAQAPHPRDLEIDVVTLRHEAEDIAEEEGLPQGSYDPEQQARLDWMLHVRPLIGLDPSQMSEQAANEAAAQLRTCWRTGRSFPARQQGRSGSVWAEGALRGEPHPHDHQSAGARLAAPRDSG